MSYITRLIGLLSAMVVLGVMIPATTTAAPPTRLSGSQTGVLCELPSEAGFTSVVVQTAGTDVFAFLAVWAPDTEPKSRGPRSHVASDERNTTHTSEE